MTTPEKELNQILDDLRSIQNRVAVFSDELDSETLEDAEGAIDIVMDKIIKAIKENGWKIKKMCESCAYFIFDEDLEEYICDCHIYEDGYYHISQGSCCPYYRNGDEYAVVRRQL